MILKMVEIHQVDFIDDISKGFVDGGDRSIKSLLRHSVNLRQKDSLACTSNIIF